MTYLTVKQIAEALGIDDGKVTRWIHAGELVASNIATSSKGKARWRIAEVDFLAFMARRKSQPETRTVRHRQPENVIRFY